MDKFMSRKFLITVIGAVIVGFNDLIGNPLDEGSVNNLVMLLVSYIAGQSVADTAGHFKKPPTEE